LKVQRRHAIIRTNLGQATKITKVIIAKGRFLIMDSINWYRTLQYSGGLELRTCTFGFKEVGHIKEDSFY
jgi:hypothetical protein